MLRSRGRVRSDIGQFRGEAGRRGYVAPLRDGRAGFGERPRRALDPLNQDRGDNWGVAPPKWTRARRSGASGVTKMLVRGKLTSITAVSFKRGTKFLGCASESATRGTRTQGCRSISSTRTRRSPAAAPRSAPTAKRVSHPAPDPPRVHPDPERFLRSQSGCPQPGSRASFSRIRRPDVA